MKPMKRRTFIKTTALGTAAAVMSMNYIKAEETLPEAVWVENGEPKELFDRAVKEMGGLGRFISKGDVVVVKPNIGWDRAPEYAANTNPDLVEAIIKECFKVGAKKVKVFDRTCNNPQRCYRNSAIEEKAKAAGAETSHMKKNRYKPLQVNGELVKEWPIYKDYLDADKVINVPIAKHHSMATVSLGLKNLMGVFGEDRGKVHKDFSTRLIDIDKEILPQLTIIDGYRILTNHGPRGGNLEDVVMKKTLIMSPCTVNADILGLQLFGHKLEDIDHINMALKRGLNKYDPKTLKLKKVVLS